MPQAHAASCDFPKSNRVSRCRRTKSKIRFRRWWVTTCLPATGCLSRPWSGKGPVGSATRHDGWAQILGDEKAIGWGFDANNNPPVLHTHDARGPRIDEVRFHPAWHSLMRLSVAFGLHNLPWREGARAATWRGRHCFFMAGAERSGAQLPDLDDLRRRCRRCAGSRTWPPSGSRASPARSTIRDSLPAAEKSGALIGMAMTEKQGGFRRAGQHLARRAGRRRRTWRRISTDGTQMVLLGADVRRVSGAGPAPAGLSCFLLPRWTPDGTRNQFFLQRLKNKLGNRSNASSESNSTTRRPRWWARKAAASGRFWRWSTTPGSTARWARPARCGRPWCKPRTTRGIAAAFGPAAGRTAADAKRAGRPGHRIGGRHGAGDAAGPVL